MGRRAKAPKGKAEPKQSPARRPPKSEGARVRDLEKRLAESLKRETVAQEQRAAAAEILRVISSSPTDVQPVFDTIVQRAARLCHAATAGVFRSDGRMVYLQAGYGASAEASATIRARFPQPLDTSTTAGMAILTRSVVHVPDTEEPSAVEYVRQTGRLLGFRSLVTVPMLRESEAVGAIIVNRREPGPFSDVEVSLLQTFADQAVIAIENVRLFKELEVRNTDLTEALEQQTATADILRVISQSPTELQPVLDALVKRAVRFCGADDSLIHRLEGDRLPCVAHHGPIPAQLGHVAPVVGTTAGRCVLERRAIHVADLQAETEEFPEGSAIAREFSYHTILSVPLLREGVPLGAIILRRAAVEPFSDKQIALLHTFADQAVIAIENVRLFTELQQKNAALTQAHAQVSEALEQQTATSEVLRVISSSPTDLQPVFDAIVDSAVRLVRGLSGAVYQYDGEFVHQVALSDATSEIRAEYQRMFPRRPHPSSFVDRAILDGAITHIAAAQNASELRESARHIAAMRGYHAILVVPMLREGVPIGAISVSRAEAGLFSDTQIALLKTFADQAVIAIENVRLFTELEARNRDLMTALDRQTATSEILRVISQSQVDVQPVFDTIVQSAARLCHAASAGVFLTDGQTLDLPAN